MPFSLSLSLRDCEQYEWVQLNPLSALFAAVNGANEVCRVRICLISFRVFESLLSEPICRRRLVGVFKGFRGLAAGHGLRSRPVGSSQLKGYTDKENNYDWI